MSDVGTPRGRRAGRLARAAARLSGAPVRPRRALGERREAGAATVFVVGMAVVLMACAGLAVDGGLAINARMAAADDAEQAARIGADSIDVATLRDSGRIAIDEVRARERAASFLATRGYGAGQYAVSVAGDTVQVTVRGQTETLILGIIGIRRYDVEASASSTPQTGF